MKIRFKQYYPKAFLAMALLLSGITSFAETTQKSATDNSLATMLIVVACALLLAIILLGYVLINAAQFYHERLKEKRQKEAIASKSIVIIALCVLFSPVLKAQEAVEQAVQKGSSVINGMVASSFYALISIIALELIVILVMAYFIKLFIAKEKAVTVTGPVKAKQHSFKTWWQKMNSMKPQSEEKEIMLAHDYDGIQELDNRLPRWWIWGFYISIVFAGVYLYRYHVAHSAPLSKEEYEIAMVQAEQQKEAYLKKSANLVDENTVTLLTDAAAIQEGEKMYAGNCAPCHGDKGQGVVGPNLTDSYWLHGGSIHDVFKTIKYGYPEKGMKSWKDDFSPVQIAKIASYIKSLHGTNPSNAKEPQGDLYKEEDASAKKDSVSTNAKKLSEVGLNKQETPF